MPRRILRKIPFLVHLSCILRDTWNNVIRDAGSWRVKSAYGMRLAACLHGAGGHQVGEVTCDGSPRLSCKRNQVKMRDYMDRWVTPPNRVTSPAWSPPPPCKPALIVLKMKRVSVNNSSEGEGYTSEIWRSTLESNGLLV